MYRVLKMITNNRFLPLMCTTTDVIDVINDAKVNIFSDFGERIFDSFLSVTPHGYMMRASYMNEWILLDVYSVFNVCSAPPLKLLVG